VLRYGIELDAYRAEQARAIAHEVIHGSAFDVHCPVQSFSLLYLNPPFDFEWAVTSFWEVCDSACGDRSNSPA
jgi:hypothetical protein